MFSDRPHLFVLDELNKGLGIVASSGQLWKEQRRFTLSTLRDFGMGKHLAEHAISEECIHLTKVIQEKNGEVFDVRQDIHVAVANIIHAILMGKRFSAGDEFFQKITDCMDEGSRLVASTAGLNFIPFGRYIPGDPFKYKATFRNNKFMLGKVVKPSIEEHIKNFDSDKISDFISAYLKEIKSKEKSEPDSSTINIDNLVIVISDLIFAGSETTTTTIRWMLLLLMKHPEIQEKCFREIKENIGLDQMPVMSDKLKLPYNEAAISEAQRIANIVPLSVWHSVPEDVNFRGFRFPKGVIVLPSLDSVLHDPEIFDNPTEFRPERFLGEDGKFVKHPKMIPFFLGKRNCVGESLARMELFLFITNLIQRFRFQHPQGEPPLTMEAVPGITYSPKPFKMIAVPR